MEALTKITTIFFETTVSAFGMSFIVILSLASSFIGTIIAIIAMRERKVRGLHKVQVNDNSNTYHTGDLLEVLMGFVPTMIFVAAFHSTLNLGALSFMSFVFGMGAVFIGSFALPKGKPADILQSAGKGTTKDEVEENEQKDFHKEKILFENQKIYLYHL